MQDFSVVQQSVDSLTGQSGTPLHIRSTQRYADAGRQIASGLESAVELRLAKKALASRKISLALRSSQLRAPALLPDRARHRSLHRACQCRPRVYEPNHARSVAHNRSWAQWIQRLPTRTGYSHGVRTPCVPQCSRTSGETIRFLHGSILSDVGASTKPGAVQRSSSKLIFPYRYFIEFEMDTISRFYTDTRKQRAPSRLPIYWGCEHSRLE